jgi:hypothetical protein
MKIQKGPTMKTVLLFAQRLILACALCHAATAQGAAIFTPNSQPTGWVAEVDVSNYNFSDGKQVLFKPDFIKANWTGNLFAFPVNADGTILFEAEEYSGGVAAEVAAQNYDTGRKIVTMKKDGTKIPFRYASLESSQADALEKDDKKAAAIINFIRGDRANEKPLGQNYRKRSGVLGDIIHSRPVFVPHATEPRVYVGANDGMLHAFHANTGEEVFAYLPSFFISPVAAANFSHIKALIVDPYVHNYYVDASPNAQKVKISGVDKTILVSGVGAGGKGLFALDITDPIAGSEAAAASKILWEITPSTINNAANTAYADLGHTYGIPVIAKLNDGTWAALVANGYNNTGSNQAVLYVINLMTGAKIAGITTSVGGTSDSNPNGLSSPTAIDSDFDGDVDYVYAGDINGNLWKFDIRNIASPVVTKLYTTSPAQPITGRPAVALHPNGGYMINFATGRMFTSADATDATTVYYAYGIRDNGTTIDPANIVSQTLIAKTWSAGGFNYNIRVSSSNPVDYGAATPKQGWKLALPAGERVVGDGGLVTNQRYHFTSTNPTVAYAPIDGVVQPQGTNWLNEIDFTTGGGGSAPVFDLDSNLSLGDSDRVRAADGTSPQAGPTGIPVSRFISTGVMSQPIVARLQTLSQTYFNTNPDLALSSTTSTGDPGVSGGHFDFDIYYSSCTITAGAIACPRNTHIHEYDDKYNVTGVNLLATSSAAHNIVNAIPATTTQFKILMANQKMSPAVKFLRGGLAGVPVTDYLTGPAPLSMASLPTYTRANVTTLIWALPLDAFASKDWTGTGDVRAGVVPTATGCVRSNKGGGTAESGPQMNGALMIQLVKATTPDSAVELNIPGDPSMGYRLKKDAASQSNQLAMWTIFWHHPNGKCTGDAAWVKNPPQDFDGNGGKASAGAPGSDDPKDGMFGSGGGAASGGGSGGGSVAGPSSTVTYTFADGSSVTQTTTLNADGSVTVTRVYSYGGTESFTIPPTSGGRESDTRAKTGRVSWREMIRP